MEIAVNNLFHLGGLCPLWYPALFSMAIGVFFGYYPVGKAAKFVTKQIGTRSAVRFLVKTHRPAYTLDVAGLIHPVLSFRIFATTPVIVYILRIICILSLLVSIAAFIIKKKLGD